jgi:integrase
VPVVLSRSEVEAVLGHLEPPYRLVGLLLYGCGLRLAECVGLRVQCFNLDAMLLTVHDGKGQKDRTVPLPARALPERTPSGFCFRRRCVALGSKATTRWSFSI